MELHLKHHNISTDFKIKELDKSFSIDNLNDKGFCSSVPILDKEEVDELNNEINWLVNDKFNTYDGFYYKGKTTDKLGNNAFVQMSGMWQVSRIIHDIIWHPVITDILWRFYKESSIFIQDHIFQKPSFYGSSIAWHQDKSYWKNRFTPINNLTVWIALEDVDELNGCLYYIPRSHNWNIELPSVSFTDDKDSIKKFIPNKYLSEFDNAVPAVLKAGQCTIHHSGLIHCSGKNTSSNTRTGLTLVFGESNMRSLMTDKHKKDNKFPYIERGKLLRGKYFPEINKNGCNKG